MQPGKTVKSVFNDLEIERGRSVHPKLNVDEGLCLSCCNVVEDEEHFVTACKDNEVERALFTNKLEKRDPSFANLTNREKLIFLMTCTDSQILTWFGKFIYHSLLNRNMLRHNMRKLEFILCMYMYVYVCMCMYIYTRFGVYVCMRTCVRICVCTCVCICMHVYMYMYVYMCMCTNMCMYMYMYMNMYMYMILAQHCGWCS